MNCDSLFSSGSQHASRAQNRCRLAGVVIQSVEVTPSLTQCRHPAGDNVDRLGGGPGGHEEEELALPLVSRETNVSSSTFLGHSMQSRLIIFTKSKQLLILIRGTNYDRNKKGIQLNPIET